MLKSRRIRGEIHTQLASDGNGATQPADPLGFTSGQLSG